MGLIGSIVGAVAPEVRERQVREELAKAQEDLRAAWRATTSAATTIDASTRKNEEARAAVKVDALSRELEALKVRNEATARERRRKTWLADALAVGKGRVDLAKRAARELEDARAAAEAAERAVEAATKVSSKAQRALADARARRDRALAAYNRAPSDGAWSERGEAANAAERAGVDNDRASKDLASAKAALAEAARRAEVARAEHLSAALPALIDAATVEYLMQIGDRVRDLFDRLRERQPGIIQAYSDANAARETVGLEKLKVPRCASLAGLELADYLFGVWAAARFVAGGGPATVWARADGHALYPRGTGEPVGLRSYIKDPRVAQCDGDLALGSLREDELADLGAALG